MDIIEQEIAITQQQLALVALKVQRARDADTDLADLQLEYGRLGLQLRQLEQDLDRERNRVSQATSRVLEQALNAVHGQRKNEKPPGHVCQCTNGNEHLYCVQHGTCW